VNQPEWSIDNVGTYNKTPHSDRKWCKDCGGHIFTEYPGTGLTDGYAAVILSFPHYVDIHIHHHPPSGNEAANSG
jgi:hypothetical protein